MQLPFGGPEFRETLRSAGEFLVNRRRHTIAYGVQELIGAATKNGAVRITWDKPEAKVSNLTTVKTPEESTSSNSTVNHHDKSSNQERPLNPKKNKAAETPKTKPSDLKPASEGLDQNVARVNIEAIFDEIDQMVMNK